MKKHVRVYKPVNKFQQGGAQGEAQYTDEQLLEFILQTLSQPDGTIEEAQQKLLQSNIDPNRIMKLSQAATNYLQEQEDMKRAKMSEDDEAVQDIEANQALEEDQMQEQAAREQRMQEMYQSQMQDIDEGVEDETAYMAYGGVPNKKSFIRSYMKLAKKAEGGNTADDTDIPIDGRSEQLNKFLGAVKTTATDAALKEQAEQAYEQQMQMQMQMPMYGEDMPEAQFGGGLFQGMRQRRAARNMGQMLFNPMLAQFTGAGNNLGLANIDVKKVGLFGRPKEYTINFNTMPFNAKTVAAAADQVASNKKDVERKKAVEYEVGEDGKPIVTKTSTETTTTPVTTTSETTPKIYTFNTGNSTQPQQKSTSSGSKVRNARPVEDFQETVEQAPVQETPVAQPTMVNPSIYTTKNTSPTTIYRDPSRPNLRYYVGPDGKMYYDDDRTDVVENNLVPEARVQALSKSKNLQGANLYTLPGKKGYYYRQRADGSYAKFEGDPSKHSNKSKQVGVIKPGDKNYNYLNTNAEYKRTFQAGGFTDEQSGLYKFFGGGEDPSIPQLDIDYTDSKNTADPYFKHGGLTQYQTAGTTPKVDYTIDPRTGKAWTDEDWNALTKKKEEAKSTSPFSPEQEAWFQKNYGNLGQQAYYPQVGYNPYLSAVAPGLFGGNRAISYAGSWDKLKSVTDAQGNPVKGSLSLPMIKSFTQKENILGLPKSRTIEFSAYEDTSPMFQHPFGAKPLSEDLKVDKPVINGSVSPDADIYGKLNRRQALRAIPSEMKEFAYGGYLPQAQTGNFPAMQLPLKDTRKDKSVSSYKGPKYNVPTQKNIPSETTQKVGNYARSAGADQQRASELRMQAAKDIAAKNNRNLGTDYNTALANANRQVQSADFNPGEYMQRQATKDLGSGPASSAVVKASTPQSDTSRAWEYITNPLTAAEYAISGGGAENMPHGINEMRMAGIDPGAVQGRNLVGNAINSNVNILDAADKVVRNTQKGNYLTAGAEALRLIPAGKAAQAGIQEFKALKNSGALGNVANIAEGVGLAGETAVGALHLHDAAGLLKEKAIHAGAHNVDHELHQMMGVGHHAYGGMFELPKAQIGPPPVGSNRTGYPYMVSDEELENMSFPEPIDPNAKALPKLDTREAQEKYLEERAKEDEKRGFNITPEDIKEIEENAEITGYNPLGTKKDFKAETKTKNAWDINTQAALNQGNARINQVLGWIENAQSTNANNDQLAAYMSDNLNTANARRNRGSFDVNSGLEDPDKMGFTGVAAYGGMFQDGGYYDQNDEVYMTEDEIEDFLANGGELEYIND